MLKNQVNADELPCSDDSDAAVGNEPDIGVAAQPTTATHGVRQRVIYIEQEAPPKPATGAPCNGCGVCCLTEPCPVGALVSRKRSGVCSALRWDPAQRQYRCGALVEPAQVLAMALPRWMAGFAGRAAPWLARLGPRWIAAGKGCDCTLEVDRQSAL